MKDLIDNKYANLYLNAAVKLGMKFKILNKKISYAEIHHNKKTLRICEHVLDINSELSKRLAANKKKTSILLQSNEIPSPKSHYYCDMQKAKDSAQKMLNKNIQIVIKPTTGSMAKGVTILPRTKKAIHRALKESFDLCNTIIIEEYIMGNHYRISTYKNSIIAITQRIPAHVTGDGKKTISELVHAKNIHRNKRHLPPITLCKEDISHLKTNNMHLSTILKKDEVAILHHGCDMDIGGDRKKINISKIPTENREMFLKAAQVIGLDHAGIDYISPDINISHTDIKSAINEINSAPHPDVHYKGTYPFDNYAAEKLLREYFHIDISIVQNHKMYLSAIEKIRKKSPQHPRIN